MTGGVLRVIRLVFVCIRKYLLRKAFMEVT